METCYVIDFNLVESKLSERTHAVLTYFIYIICGSSLGGTKIEIQKGEKDAENRDWQRRVEQWRAGGAVDDDYLWSSSSSLPVLSISIPIFL